MFGLNMAKTVWSNRKKVCRFDKALIVYLSCYFIETIEIVVARKASVTAAPDPAGSRFLPSTYLKKLSMEESC